MSLRAELRTRWRIDVSEQWLRAVVDSAQRKHVQVRVIFALHIAKRLLLTEFANDRICLRAVSIH